MPFSYDDRVEVTKIGLERQAYMLSRMVELRLLQHFAIDAQTQRRIEYDLDTMVFHFRQEVLSEHLDRATARYPRTWREGLKEACYAALVEGKHWPWLGTYLRQRWPVVYQVIEINAKALYPKIGLPEHEHVLTFLRADRIEV